MGCIWVGCVALENVFQRLPAQNQDVQGKKAAFFLKPGRWEGGAGGKKKKKEENSIDGEIIS